MAVSRPANWHALSQRLRPSLIATAVMTLFLGVWQFLVPGGENLPAPSLTSWAYLGAVWLLFPNAIVFAGSASRSLWRERHRAAAFLPVPTFLACALGLPVMVELIGISPTAALWAFPAGLLLSATASVAIIVRSPVGSGAAGEPTAGDEPHAYARDVEQRTPKGDA